MRFLGVGHVVFALTMIGVGILGLALGDFVQIWQPVPKAFPAREVLIYLCAAISMVCGVGVLWRRTAVPSARVLFFYLLVWMLAFKLRFILLAPTTEGSYQSNGENAVIVAGSWVLYVLLASVRDRRRPGFFSGDSGLRAARVLYGLAMIAFGLSHFFYLDLTAPLMPAWLPWHVGWAYFTGAAYLAAGVAIITGICAKPAAMLSALQMGLFTLLVWLPRALDGSITASQWGEFIVSWTLTAAAWVVADSYRGAGGFFAGSRNRIRVQV
ncbi:MAG TPA: hypothetical protein VN693_00470 [Rhodanobacteraceae bacterium]|nr:hypothetical protein [Rhodanobacteraceae bacterium]